MAQPWEPEIEIDEDLVRRLVSRWPDLQDQPLERIGAGWDNTAWRVGSWVFRFPHKAAAVAFMDTEIAHGARIAAALPVPITAPTRVGEPSDVYPYRFAGYPLLAGRTACRDLSEAERAGLAEPLGAFLRVLHAVDPSGLPRDPLGKGDVAVRSRKVHAWAARLDGFTAEDLDRITGLGATPLWDRPPVTVHGDLYARHLLVEEGLVGVIDWGDLHAGDPAVDLSIAFTFLPVSARERFAVAYGPIDAATWARARFHAYRYAVALLDHGRTTGDSGMARVGGWSLEGARRG